MNWTWGGPGPPDPTLCSAGVPRPPLLGTLSLALELSSAKLPQLRSLAWEQSGVWGAAWGVRGPWVVLPPLIPLGPGLLGLKPTLPLHSAGD